MLEVESAKKTLESVADALENLGVRYWLDSGTLLAAYRDKNINIYDHDLDIRVFENEVDKNKLADIIRAFWLCGFNCIYDSRPQKAEVQLRNRYLIQLDFKLCYQNELYLWYYCWRRPSPIPMVHLYPKDFFHPMGEIELLGRTYPCPQPIQEYICYHYGAEWELFKVSLEDANETDATWDYMKDPPCALTLEEFREWMGVPPIDTDEDGREPISSFWTKPPIGTKILYRCSVCNAEVVGEMRAIVPTDPRKETNAKQAVYIEKHPCEHRDKLQLIEFLGDKCTIL